MITSNLLRGERTRLTAVENRDVATLVRWWEDADFLRHFDSTPAFPKSEDQLSRQLSDQQQDNSSFLFGVREVDGDELIGLLQLDGIQWPHRTTFIALGIGDRSHWGRGFGREAMQLGLQFAFQELNLYRVVLTVFSYNERAIALYESLGFVREGIYREHLERDGVRYDMVLYGLLRPEWLATIG